MDFKILESHYLDFPTEIHDYTKWHSMGAAFLHKNKAVLAPQTVSKKGLLYNIVPVEHTNWMVDMELKIENGPKTHRGGAGFAFYYLTELDKDKFDDSVFGYSNIYDGVAVILNSILRSTDKSTGAMHNMVQGIPNNGKEVINPFTAKKNSCYKGYRNLDDPEQFVKLRVIYEDQLLTVKL
jgi:hypothetical protein